MTFRLRKYLPGWPAVLVMPAVLGWWFVQCIQGGTFHFGWPLHIRPGPVKYLPLRIDYVLTDVVLALATAYIVAMGAEWLGRSMTRAAHRKKRCLEEPN